MFNDALDLRQCAKLVESLCETALPFQCAHGRYVSIGGRFGRELLRADSMVFLVDRLSYH